MRGTNLDWNRDGAMAEKGNAQVTTAMEISRQRRWLRNLGGWALGACLFGLAATAGAAASDEMRFELRSRPLAPAALPPLPSTAQFPVQLVVDDDAAEGAFGVAAGQAARQFLWFNRFGPVPTFTLSEVWVLFPVDAPVGGAVQIAVFEDGDGDPTTGATLRAAFDATVQAADGNTFSVYPLPAPLLATSGADLLIGVVPRFVVSGQTPPLLPAALDTTASAGRSWFATWSADPPDPPALPGDQLTAPVDGYQPGNWMIRGFGTYPTAQEIPALGARGFALLAGLLALAGFVQLRRRRAALLALPLALFAAGAGAQTTIDSFTTNQAALSDPPGGNSVATGGADILGTRRGILVKNLRGAGPTTAGVAAGALTLTVAATTPDSRGEARLSWDGDTNAAVLSPTGLGGVNLTGSFARGFRIRVNSATAAGGELVLTVYTDGANYSKAARRLPLIAAATDVLVPFSEFRVAGGTGADFSDVGAVEMTVRGSELTLAIDLVDTSFPAVAATKVDAQTVDVDGDTRVDPGDRVRYTVTVTNTGNEALGIGLSDTIDGNTTLVAGSVSSTPIARNDQYGWFGNVDLSVDGSPSLPGLLANDSDPDGDTVTVQAGSFPATTVQGGTLTLVDAATGDFDYAPPVGFSGVDSFSYTIVDDNLNPSTAVAYLQLEGVVWFVDDTDPGGANLGTKNDPFITHLPANVAGPGGAGDQDGPGDVLFFYAGAHVGTLPLEADQQLLGEGEGLVLGGVTIVPAGADPTWTTASGPAIQLATNNTIRGFTLGNTAGADILGSAFGTLTVGNVVLNGTGQALDLTNGTLAATFESIASASSTGRGLLLDAVGGSLSSPTTTVTGSTDDALRIANAPAGATYGFGAASLGATGAANGLELQGNSGTAATTFSSLAVTTGNGTALFASSGGVLNVSGSSNTLVATGGAALDAASTSFGAGATFSNVSSTSSTGKGVNLDTVTGSVTATGGSITGAAGACFDVNGGSGNISYAGAITCTANAYLVEITGRTGGTVTLSGNLSGTGSSNGINVASNSGGTIAFSGTTKTLNTAADAAVTLATNTGATINFTGGGLDIDTTSGTGFNATGGATSITVQGSGNSITSTTGTALNVANTTIGASGLTFQSISANGAVNGIVLSATGANGGLTVTGTGTTPGTGGAIQNISGRGASFANAVSISLANMNFTNTATSAGAPCGSAATAGANTGCNAAIHLSNVTGVALDRLNLTTSGQQGINGLDVTNFALTNSALSGLGNAPDEDGLHFTNLLGTNSISATTIASSGDDNVNVQNLSSTASTLNITGGSFNTGVLGSGLLFGSRNSANLALVISGVTVNDNFSGGIVADNFDTATARVTVTGSTITNNNDGVQVSDNNGSARFNISGNTFSGQDFVNITLLKAAFSTGGTLEGAIENNIVTVSNGRTADGFSIFNAGGGALTVRVAGNTISYAGTQRAILAQAGQDGSGSLDLTMTGNSIDIQLDGAGNAVAGLLLQSGITSPSGDGSSICGDLGGSTPALKNTFTHSLGGAMAGGDLRVRQRNNGTAKLPGFAGPATDTAGVVAYLTGRNTLVSTPTATADSTGFANAACAVPVLP